jgi:hypothetical protein
VVGMMRMLGPRAMTEREIAYTLRRQKQLPERLDRARRAVRALLNEAERYGMTELLTNTAHIDAAWDRMIGEAQDYAKENGGDIGFEVPE